MNSKNLGARNTENRAWNKRYGFESFQGQNSLFRRFWGSSRIFGVVGGSLAQKTGLLRNLGNFQEFLWNFGGFKVV
jgi:hypothetical protein